MKQTSNNKQFIIFYAKHITHGFLLDKIYFGHYFGHGICFVIAFENIFESMKGWTDYVRNGKLVNDACQITLEIPV